MTKIRQQAMDAEIRRSNAAEAVRRDELDRIRRAEEAEAERQREEDRNNPVIQDAIRRGEYERFVREKEAEEARVAAEAERKAKHDAELRAEYDFQRNAWIATGHPAETFDSDRWPEVLQRRHADATAADDAERQRLIAQSRVF